MPIYSYKCPSGHEHEDLKKVGERATNECPTCGVTAELVITPVHLDYLNCGWDMGLPTAAAKWTKMQWKKNTGKQWDSNNRRYGGEHERKRS